MGFKRTSEGRIFFQGANESANHADQKTDAMSQHAQGQGQGQGQVTQLQILTLLKGLNERLKTTQAERNKMRKELNRYREVIEHLEEKAEKSEETQRMLAQAVAKNGKEGTSTGRTEQTEQMARDTLIELEETRKMLLQLEEKAERTDHNINALKTSQQDQARKMASTTAGYTKLTKRVQGTEERQEDLGDKVEESISQQARLVRKIDKTIEDRARFMRKIERIEETVLQTRDSLNAKAMVLLTDQSSAAQVALEDGMDMPAAMQGPEPDMPSTKKAPLWNKSFQMQPLTMAMFLVAVLLSGWALNEMQNKTLPDLSQYTSEDLGRAGVQQPIDRAEATTNLRTPQSNTENQSFQPWTIVEENVDAFSEEALAQPQPVANIELGAADDIGTVTLQSDKDLVALLDENSQQVASTLNTIEPGSIQTINRIPETPAVEETIQAVETEVEVRPDPPQPQQIEAAARAASANNENKVVAKTPLLGSPTASNIPSDMRPDGSLPEVIKNIEAQAFNGVPEAQHDLAAVYTAGHAGVKQDYQRAAFWFKKAANNGIANAAYNLGVLNHQGLGIKTDTDEAVRWYQEASKLGHPEAQYNLGIAYIEGIGVPYDPIRASEYFENAAGQGITEAAYNLGLIHENGLLGDAKPDEALVWYKSAADQGSPEAKAALEQLAKTLGVGLDDVNRLAERMKSVNNTPAVTQAPVSRQTQSAPSATPTPIAPVTATTAPIAAATAASTEELFVDASQEKAQMLVAQVQEYLIRLGLYPGPADGVVGPLTSDAVRSYQSLNDLSVDGVVREELLSHMLANSAEYINWNDEENAQGSRVE